jgi:peptidoglycan/LPS O-acetylase OafA/YrhL
MQAETYKSVATSPSTIRHVAGLDSIRFICASWVLFGHLGFFPLTDSFDRATRVGYVVRGFFGNLFCGPAAVIVFFVISGFCIHYPYRDGRPLALKAYYSRRYVRIFVPMVAAIALGVPLRLHLEFLNDSILWSLLAEEIYYFLYPLAFVPLRRRAGWRPIIAVAYALSLLVALTNPYAGNYPWTTFELALGPAVLAARLPTRRGRWANGGAEHAAALDVAGRDLGLQHRAERHAFPFTGRLPLDTERIRVCRLRLAGCGNRLLRASRVCALA